MRKKVTTKKEQPAVFEERTYVYCDLCGDKILTDWDLEDLRREKIHIKSKRIKICLSTKDNQQYSDILIECADEICGNCWPKIRTALEDLGVKFKNWPGCYLV